MRKLDIMKFLVYAGIAIFLLLLISNEHEQLLGFTIRLNMNITLFRLKDAYDISKI
jgi:hypothetical protein